jgi:hypothetical protein
VENVALQFRKATCRHEASLSQGASRAVGVEPTFAAEWHGRRTPPVGLNPAGRCRDGGDTD